MLHALKRAVCLGLPDAKEVLGQTTPQRQHIVANISKRAANATHRNKSDAD